MGYIKCKNGHTYDPSVTPTCPQCVVDAGAGFESYGATEAVGAGSKMGNIGTTEPFIGNNGERFAPIGFNRRGGADSPDTIPLTSDAGGAPYAKEDAAFGKNSPFDNETPNYENINIRPQRRDDFGAMPPTEPLSSIGGSQNRAGGFEMMPVTMPLGFNNNRFPDSNSNYRSAEFSESFRPVVGWLVCVEGADRGRDYHIRDGYNTIGREPGNDIAIQNDNYISREKHAMIAYDRREKIFFFGPAEGRNIVRLNGKLLMQASEIKPYDMIDFESTKLIFVPFCGERFNWDE